MKDDDESSRKNESLTDSDTTSDIDLLPVVPCSSFPLVSKKLGSDHWTTSELGSLISRATAHVYRMIIAPHSEGGLKDFFHDNCHLHNQEISNFLASLTSENETNLDNHHQQINNIITTLYDKYQNHINIILSDFLMNDNFTLTEILSLKNYQCHHDNHLSPPSSTPPPPPSVSISSQSTESSPPSNYNMSGGALRQINKLSNISTFKYFVKLLSKSFHEIQTETKSNSSQSETDDALQLEELTEITKFEAELCVASKYINIDTNEVKSKVSSLQYECKTMQKRGRKKENTNKHEIEKETEREGKRVKFYWGDHMYKMSYK